MVYYTSAQYAALERVWATDQKPNNCTEIGEPIGLTNSQVYEWFRNKRRNRGRYMNAVTPGKEATLHGSKAVVPKGGLGKKGGIKLEKQEMGFGSFSANTRDEEFAARPEILPQVNQQQILKSQYEHVVFGAYGPYPEPPGQTIGFRSWVQYDTEWVQRVRAAAFRGNTDKPYSSPYASAASFTQAAIEVYTRLRHMREYIKHLKIGKEKLEKAIAARDESFTALNGGVGEMLIGTKGLLVAVEEIKARGEPDADGLEDMLREVLETSDWHLNVCSWLMYETSKLGNILVTIKAELRRLGVEGY